MAVSARVQEQLADNWTDVVKRLPPAERAAWLDTPEAIAELGAKMVSELRKSLKLSREGLAHRVPSMPWLDAWWLGGQAMPTEDREHGKRPGAVKMKLSRCETRIGSEKNGHRRWTPPQAVVTEDLLDAMTPLEAMRHEYPISPSAAVIRKIAEMRATEV